MCVGCMLRVCVCHLFDPGFDRHADPHLPDVGLAHAEQRAELFVCVCVLSVCVGCVCVLSVC